jgi:hypothetical protein
VPLVANVWCCCTSPPPDECIVFTDNFNRGNSTSLGSDWTETSGDAEIYGNALRCTATGVVVTCNTDSPAAERAMLVDLAASTANNLAQVHVGDWKIQIKFSTTAGSVAILDSGGTTKVTSATNLNLSLDTFHTLTICYDGETLEAELEGIDRSFVSFPASISNLTNGVGTGATLSGSVTFDNWELRKLDAELNCLCPHSPGGGDQGCNYCTGFFGPYYILGELAGYTNDAFCTGCSNFNRPYVMTSASNSQCFPVTEATSCCCWRAPNGPLPASCTSPTTTDYPILTLQVCSAYETFSAGLRGRVFNSGGGGYDLFEHTASTPFDCLGLSGLVIPVTAHGARCNGSSTTLTLTALV